jgi:hypothetical protein
MKLNCTNSERALTKTDTVVVIAIFAAFAVFVGSDLYSRIRMERHRTYRSICINNLKQIGLAFRMWAIDHGDKFPMELSMSEGGTSDFVSKGVYPHFQALSNQVSGLMATARIFYCPADAGKARPARSAASFTESNISYFVGADAVGALPSSFLAGDRNLTNNTFQPPSRIMLLTSNSAVGWTKKTHIEQGHIGLADGTVQAWSTRRLREGLANTGLATNRLIMPLE